MHVLDCGLGVTLDVESNPCVRPSHLHSSYHSMLRVALASVHFVSYALRMVDFYLDCLAGCCAEITPQHSLLPLCNVAELTRDDRKKLYSNFGLLYPHGHNELSIAEDFDQIRAAMEKVPAYASVFNKVRKWPHYSRLR